MSYSYEIRIFLKVRDVSSNIQSENMKIFKNTKSCVFVMTNGDPQTNCPTLTIDSSKTIFRDDYYGKVRVAKKFLSKLSKL